MKQLLSSFIMLCYLTLNHCLGQQQSAYFNDKDSIFISGKINGFKPQGDNNFISFLTTDIDGSDNKHSFQISTDGSYHIALDQHFAGDITMSYRSAFTSVFAKPGCRLQIQIENKAIDADEQPDKVFLATGELSEVNNLIFKFESEVREHDFVQQANMGDKKQNDSTFAARRCEKLTEELAFLNTFIKSRNIHNQQFADWQKNQLIYMAGNEILLFPFLGKINSSISESQLLGLIRSIPVDNPTALYNSAYYVFLNRLAVDQQIIVNINPDYEPIKKQNGNNSIPVNLDQFDKLASGVTREILYYDLYLSRYKINPKKNNTSPSSERFESVIAEPYLKKMYQVMTGSVQDKFQSYHIISRIQQLNISNKLKTRLLDIFEKASGSNIFIDFWGDWCGPCMIEMPNYPKLIASFVEKPVKFIFFSVHTTKESADHVKEKYRINGDFINLTNDEIAIVNNVFEFHAYPAHFVVNNQGFVVGKDTKKQEEIERLLFK